MEDWAPSQKKGGERLSFESCRGAEVSSKWNKILLEPCRPSEPSENSLTVQAQSETDVAGLTAFEVNKSLFGFFFFPYFN